MSAKKIQQVMLFANKTFIRLGPLMYRQLVNTVTKTSKGKVILAVVVLSFL